MATIKYQVKENTTIGTQSFFAQALTYSHPKGSEILGCKRGCYAVLGWHVVLRPLSNSAMPCRRILHAASSSRW